MTDKSHADAFGEYVDAIESAATSKRRALRDEYEALHRRQRVAGRVERLLAFAAADMQANEPQFASAMRFVEVARPLVPLVASGAITVSDALSSAHAATPVAKAATASELRSMVESHYSKAIRIGAPPPEHKTLTTEEQMNALLDIFTAVGDMRREAWRWRSGT